MTLSSVTPSLCYVGGVAIAGDRPETGVRIAIERPREEAAPWSYEGVATLPTTAFPVKVVVSESGDVEVSLSPSKDDGAAAPADLAEKIRLIVRAAYRQAKNDEEPPAFRINRWRADK